MLDITLEVLIDLPDAVNVARLEQALQVAFRAAGTDSARALSLVVTGCTEIQALNREYRHVDAVTDVLAFGDSPCGVPPSWAEDGVPYLGDIVICYPRAAEQAEEYGHSVEDELQLLAVHGFLHLLGYDHEELDAKETMWSVQEAILQDLGLPWKP
jgi:probable rRNA maturation factor